MQYFTFPDELGHESSDNRSKRSDISERIDASVMILHCLLSLVSINESSHFSSLYFLNATDHQRGGEWKTLVSARGGGEWKTLVSSIAVHHKHFCMVLSSNDGTRNQLFCQCIADCQGTS